jgi:hypothetical protein
MCITKHGRSTQLSVVDGLYLSKKMFSFPFSYSQQGLNQRKEGTLNYMEGVNISVFIRKGANLAHFFRQMPMRQN